MKKIALLLLTFIPLLVNGQSETIQKWHDKYEDAFVMFFYNSTLNMLNMQDSEEFTKIVKDIDKMKLLRIDKESNNFTKDNYKELLADYLDEDFEELMTMKSGTANINALIKEKNGVTKGLVVLINDNSSVTIVDLKGSVPLNQIGSFAQQISSLEDEGFDFNMD